MRLPNIQADCWELRSAEESHRNHPNTFWIPPPEQRKNLKRGQAAKLIFDIEGQDEEGNLSIQGEKMWVIVAEKEDDYYIGILDNQPASVEPSEDVYLCFGAEIPFLSKHVSDIAEPPQEYVEWQLGQPPERKWPRT
jgi:hypothetical protein